MKTKMAAVLLEAPAGFSAAVELMNMVKTDNLHDLAVEVTKFIQYKVGVVNVKRWHETVSEYCGEIDLDKAQSIVNAMTYLFRSSAKEQMSQEAFSHMLEMSTLFTDPTCSTLCNVWSKQGSQIQAINVQEHLLGVGQLVDVQWKVGVAMSSDQCRNLNAPFVTLTLTVADPAGSLKIHTLELTMDQFRNFTNQLKEIGKVLEMV